MRAAQLRGLLILALAVAFLAPATAQPAATPTMWPTEAWPTATPEAVGLDPAPLDALDAAIRADRYGLIDRMVVVRHGKMVTNTRYERDYRAASRGFTGALGCGFASCADTSGVHPYNYYHPHMHPYYQGRDVHSLQSVTKSVTATLLGIAQYRGELGGMEAKLLSFFEDYDLSGVDERLRAATLEDLLTMRSGIEWHETDRPFDETNTTLQLEAADDWIQFVLDQPSDAAPGTKWVYSSGGSHLMSGILKKATGQFATDYAEAHLFGPLGIDDYHWKTTPQGYPDTEGGLYLEAEDLAKIGLLYLRDGVWDGVRLLPEGWAATATDRHAERVNGPGWGYGYQWWRLDRGETAVWAGLGFGGQFLLVVPAYDLVGVVNSWNLFGGAQAGILGDFLTALLASAKGSG